jgi:hypothetical protein
VIEDRGEDRTDPQRDRREDNEVDGLILARFELFQRSRLSMKLNHSIWGLESTFGVVAETQEHDPPGKLGSFDCCRVARPGISITKERVVNVRTGLRVALFLVVVLGAFVVGTLVPPAFSRAEDKGTGGCPHYSVVETQGHNLIVTDNQTNIVYFYTIDKDKEIGSELRLRGRLDLTQVGKEVLKPTLLSPRNEKSDK